MQHYTLSWYIGSIYFWFEISFHTAVTLIGTASSCQKGMKSKFSKLEREEISRPI